MSDVEKLKHVLIGCYEILETYLGDCDPGCECILHDIEEVLELEDSR